MIKADFLIDLHNNNELYGKIFKYYDGDKKGYATHLYFHDSSGDEEDEDDEILDDSHINGDVYEDIKLKHMIMDNADIDFEELNPYKDINNED